MTFLKKITNQEEVFQYFFENYVVISGLAGKSDDLNIEDRMLNFFENIPSNDFLFNITYFNNYYSHLIQNLNIAGFTPFLAKEESFNTVLTYVASELFLFLAQKSIYRSQSEGLVPEIAFSTNSYNLIQVNTLNNYFKPKTTLDEKSEAVIRKTLSKNRNGVVTRKAALKILCRNIDSIKAEYIQSHLWIFSIVDQIATDEASMDKILRTLCKVESFQNSFGLILIIKILFEYFSAVEQIEDPKRFSINSINYIASLFGHPLPFKTKGKNHDDNNNCIQNLLDNISTVEAIENIDMFSKDLTTPSINQWNYFFKNKKSELHHSSEKALIGKKLFENIFLSETSDRPELILQSLYGMTIKNICLATISCRLDLNKNIDLLAENVLNAPMFSPQIHKDTLKFCKRIYKELQSTKPKAA